MIFVEGALIDERVKIKIDFVKKDFAYAHIVEILNASPHRVYPECNRYPKCGGCDLLHMAYHEQLEFKRRLVANTLKKYAGKRFFCQSLRSFQRQPLLPQQGSAAFRGGERQGGCGFFPQGQP